MSRCNCKKLLTRMIYCPKVFDVLSNSNMCCFLTFVPQIVLRNNETDDFGNYLN